MIQVHRINQSVFITAHKTTKSIHPHESNAFNTPGVNHRPRKPEDSDFATAENE